MDISFGLIYFLCMCYLFDAIFTPLIMGLPEEEEVMLEEGSGDSYVDSAIFFTINNE